VTSWLDPELTSIAFCWELARRDGITHGFTSHDRDLWRGGLCYRAAPGMVPSAVERSTALDTDSVDLSGILTSDAISEADLAAGRWDEASLRLFVVDWTQPDGEAVPLIRGTLGAVQMAGDQFEVELRGPATLLDAPVSELTSPDCRAVLGDQRCRVDMAGRSLSARVTTASGRTLTFSAAQPSGIFGYGELRWLDGSNAGLVVAIAANDGVTITLAEPPALPVQPGDRAELRQGCDRRFATCRDRFANAANFRGEPHLPGNDLLTRYAG
jgi:uncharacterized phage protein (TIGR02218 family)